MGWVYFVRDCSTGLVKIGMSRGIEGLATWKAQEHTDLDRRRLKMELPDIYESYSMVSIRRYFRLVG